MAEYLTPEGEKFFLHTNYHWRDTLRWYELTDEEREDFAYWDTEEKQDEALFVRAYGNCYDLTEVSASAPQWLVDKGFDILETDSYFSGMAYYFKRDEFSGELVDLDTVRVAWVHW